MKYFFLLQVVVCAVVAILQVGAWVLGLGWNSDLSGQNTQLFLIAAGFLWIHRAIIEKQVKP